MTGRDRMVLIAVVMLAIVAGGWMLVVSPERQQAKTLNTQVEAARTTLQTAQTQLADAKASQAKYASAYASVVSLGKAVPASQEVPSLIYQLSQATNERDIGFNSIATGGSGGSSSSTPASATAASAGFTQLPFTFIFSGQYFNLERLFNSLTAFTDHTADGGLQVNGRLLTIQSVKLTPEGSSSPGKSPKLTGSITATAYVLPPGQTVTAGATATSPTGATTSAASTSSSAPATSPAIVKVTP